jgi:transposase
MNAILYVAEQDCKWRGLPRRFGNWHTIYTRMNRWAKAGVLDRIFVALQEQQIIHIKIEAMSTDSTVIKVHPDGTGALKKRPAGHRKVLWRLDHRDSYGCRGCSNGHSLLTVARCKSTTDRKAETCSVHWNQWRLQCVYGHGLGLRR